MTIAQVVAFVIDSFEGSFYTDDPVDTGGATRWGITRRTLEYFRKGPTSKADVRALTREEAIRCGVQVFADEPGISKLADWRVQLIVYDFGFHSGTERAVKALQQALHFAPADVDGRLGPRTLDAVRQHPDPRGLAWLVLTEREEFMQNIMDGQSTQRKYLLGWWRRTTKIQRLLTT